MVGQFSDLLSGELGRSLVPSGWDSGLSLLCPGSVPGGGPEIPQVMPSHPCPRKAAFCLYFVEFSSYCTVSHNYCYFTSPNENFNWEVRIFNHIWKWSGEGTFALSCEILILCGILKKDTWLIYSPDIQVTGVLWKYFNKISNYKKTDFLVYGI